MRWDVELKKLEGIVAGLVTSFDSCHKRKPILNELFTEHSNNFCFLFDIFLGYTSVLFIGFISADHKTKMIQPFILNKIIDKLGTYVIVIALHFEKL